MIGDGNKRGWMRILEATIAVMIVSTVLIVVYSKQDIKTNTPSDYVYDLQRDILKYIYSNSSLRLNVLNVELSDDSDTNYTVLDDFVGSRMAEFLNYSIEVCELKDSFVPCELDNDIYFATMYKPVFVEEVVISAELGSGENAVYSPKRLRLFVWEE